MRPSNYYDMDYEQRRACDRQQAEAEDLEHRRWLAQQAADEADDARNTMTRRHRAAMSEASTLTDELQEEIQELTTQRDELIKLLQEWMTTGSRSHTPECPAVRGADFCNCLPGRTARAILGET